MKKSMDDFVDYSPTLIDHGQLEKESEIINKLYATQYSQKHMKKINMDIKSIVLTKENRENIDEKIKIFGKMLDDLTEEKKKTGNNNYQLECSIDVVKAKLNHFEKLKSDPKFTSSPYETRLDLKMIKLNEAVEIKPNSEAVIFSF